MHSTLLAIILQLISPSFLHPFSILPPSILHHSSILPPSFLHPSSIIPIFLLYSCSILAPYVIYSSSDKESVFHVVSVFTWSASFISWKFIFHSLSCNVIKTLLGENRRLTGYLRKPRTSWNPKSSELHDTLWPGPRQESMKR